MLCSCHAVNDRTVRELVDAGARTLEEVAAACSAGTSCGSCRDQVAALVSGAADKACGGGCVDCPRGPALVMSAA